MIRRALTRENISAAPVPSPSIVRPVGLPPKPSFIETPHKTKTPRTDPLLAVSLSSRLSGNESVTGPLFAERNRPGSLKRPHSVVTTGPPGREEEGRRAKVRKIDSEDVEGEILSTSIFALPNRGSSASHQRPHLMVVTTLKTEDSRAYEGVKDGEIRTTPTPPLANLSLSGSLRQMHSAISIRSEEENNRGGSRKVEPDDMEEGEIPTAATLPLAALSLSEDVEDGEITAPTSSVARIQIPSRIQPARAVPHALEPTPFSAQDTPSACPNACAQHPLRAPEENVPIPSTFGSARATSHNTTLLTPIIAAKTVHTGGIGPKAPGQKVLKRK
ncbi:hypothetical protein PENSPDRAFT_173907 [Peniophora sp. CONT]|nr:hypothetical protein PENSPDRAFT_173907 [Peniophora sp. CONT]